MTTNESPQEDRLLTPSEVARKFNVNPKTVTRWARAGKIASIRTLGGHRRFRESEITALLNAGAEARTAEVVHTHAGDAERFEQ